MADPKGFLIVPVGFNPDDDVRAFTVSADDYLKCVLAAGAAGGGMGEPEGKLATLLAYNPDGDLRALELDANDNLIISLLGGAAWDILRSDGTDAEWDTLADVIEAAIMTADGDILIRSGGVVSRLAAGAADEVLTMVAGVPAWAAAAGGGYDEGARVYNNAEITVANNTLVNLTFNSEHWDTDGIHSTTSNTDRLVCKTAGKYVIGGHFIWYFHATGGRLCRIMLNDTSVLANVRRSADTAIPHYSNLITVYDLAVDDYVTINVRQKSGGNLNVYRLADQSPEFWMQRIG